MAPADYVNPGSVIAISVIFPVLSVVAVSGRIYHHRLRQTLSGVDDYLCCAATILLIGCSVDLIVGVAHRTVGYHSPPSGTDFNIPRIVELDKVEYSYNQMWYCAITLVKLAWLFLYRRIFRGRIFNLVSIAAICLTLSWGICFSLLNTFQCGKYIDQNWNPVPEFLNPKCVNSLAVFFANALISCFLDAVIVTIPMPLIYQLNTPMHSKLALMALFAIGLFCVGASAVRLAFYSSLWWAVKVHDMTSTPLGTRGGDDFGIVSLALFWSHIELGVALIACCLPSLKGLIVKSQLFQSLRSNASLQIFRRRASDDDMPSRASRMDNESKAEQGYFDRAVSQNRDLHSSRKPRLKPRDEYGITITSDVPPSSPSTYADSAIER